MNTFFTLCHLSCAVDISSNMQESLTGKLFQKVAKDSVHQQNEI